VRNLDDWWCCCAGGGGGGANGGGGGGGGLIFRPSYPVTPGATFVVVVGDGGTIFQSGAPTPGGNSSFGSDPALLAIGGGAGNGLLTPPSFINGGSGGGGFSPASGFGLGTPGQGEARMHCQPASVT
jgi:hypothetical protein